MTISESGLMTVRAKIYRRIEHLEGAISTASPSEIAEQVDRIRRMARDSGLEALANMAHGLESQLARSCERETLYAWTEALKDAVGCEELDKAAASIWLAALGQRHAA